MTPAIFREEASISFLRSAGPANFEPKTMRALARVSSWVVVGGFSGGGGLGGVRVADCVCERGLDRSSGSR